MRIVAEIPHADFKITIFQWEERYTIQWETPHAVVSVKYLIADLSTEAIQDMAQRMTPEIIPTFNGIYRLKADHDPGRAETWPEIK